MEIAIDALREQGHELVEFDYPIYSEAIGIFA